MQTLINLLLLFGGFFILAVGAANVSTAAFPHDKERKKELFQGILFCGVFVLFMLLFFSQTMMVRIAAINQN